MLHLKTNSEGNLVHAQGYREKLIWTVMSYTWKKNMFQWKQEQFSKG